MSRDADLLFAILALQMDFVTREQLVECGALWASDESKALPDILAEKGYLGVEERLALDGLVAAKVGRSGCASDSIASLSLDEELKSSLLALPLEEEARERVEAMSPGDGDDSTLLIKDDPGERYAPGAEIGKGGLGRVREAHDRILDREVAIKEMTKGRDVSRLLKRFAPPTSS
jgi:hypothetical protein